MSNSLRCKLSKLRFQGKITQEEYKELLEKLDGHDQFIRDMYEPKWIPCSERLPEKNGRYIVTRGLKVCNSIWNTIWNRVYIVNYSDLMGLKAEKIWWDGNVGKSDFQRVDDVIAWMPLPQPYKKRKVRKRNDN